MNKSTCTNARTPTRLLILVFAVGYLALMPAAKAVSPPPDGGYPGENTAEGTSALLHLNGGTNNTAVGWASLGFDVTGNLNTAVGAGTLLSNSADQNAATGAAALLSNTTGQENTANGAFALFSNSTGSGNTAVGVQALFSNTTASDNTAIGVAALFHNTTGFFNTATGVALFSNTTGAGNTATGYFALNDNTTGDSNTAIGDLALSSNTVGLINTAVGTEALENNINGQDNTAIGNRALVNSTGDQNTAIGAFAGQSVINARNVICIGAGVVGNNIDDSCFVGNIRGVQTQNGDAIPVVIDSAGQLGTISSSRRFKKDVRPIDNASETILTLNPVKFQYKNDKTNTPQFGLIAEDVAKVNPDLVVRDKNGEIYSVRYDQVNAMLLNEVLKEHKAFVEEQRTVQRLEGIVERLVATVKKQAVQIQTVSTRVDASRSASQATVADQ